MIRVENIDVWGFKHAIHGMRNPMNSWAKSDSRFGRECKIGENDLKLMRTLFKGGTEHRKFMRQIFISMDITAPLYWWKEFDTYKIGTVANSRSTMHKLTAKPFELSDFSTDHLTEYSREVMKCLIDVLNIHRTLYMQTITGQEKIYWWQMVQLLPESYNQMRTITMNYEVAAAIIRQREGHKLDEWRDFVNVLENSVPYLHEIMGEV